MNVAVVGASGLVGRKILDVLYERGFEIDNLYLFGGENSDGNVIRAFGKTYVVGKLTNDAIENKIIDLAFFAVSADVSKKFVPAFLNNGAYVIDNSSYFRLNSNVPLVVPCVNGSIISGNNRLIANPNCSTIMLAPVLKALEFLGVKHVTVSTYQAVSGAGKAGRRDLILGVDGRKPTFFDKPIFSNCIPKIGDFDENGYSEEEIKIINESKKILNNYRLEISATAVRVPVFNCHAQSLTIELSKEFSLEEVRNAFNNFPDIVVSNDGYPTQIESGGTDLIYVGRIRKDLSKSNRLLLWTVSDNLRTGAATNAVKIAETVKKFIV